VVPEYPSGRGPEDCQSVLRLDKGDIVYVLEQHESGWWGGHKEGDETMGWFPGSIAVVKPLDSTRAGDSVDYDGDDENSRALERDRRAVASPQGSRRGCPGDATQDVHQQLLHDLASEQKHVKDLEDLVCMEREWKEKYSEDVRRLEAEISRVRTERDAEKQERERERREREGREKNEKLNQERNQSEAHARMEQEVSELRTSLRISDQEVSRLKEEMGKKENQENQMQAELSRRCEQNVIRQAPQPAVKMCSPGPDARLQLKLMKPRDDRSVTETSALQCSPPGSASRDDSATRAAIGRQASASVTRQLFAQPVADDPPAISARGMTRHVSDPQVQIQGSHLTPTNHSSLTTSTSTSCQPMPSVRLVSAVPPRPSPRGNLMQSGMAPAQSAPMQPWRSHSQGAPVAASPRGAKAIAAQHGIDSRPPAAVRAIVSDIEKRSASQAPGPAPRTVECVTTPCTTTPHRGTVGTAVEFPTFTSSTGATTRAASATAPTSSMRIHSTGPPPLAMAATASVRGRQQGNESEMMYSGSPHAGEDPHVVFGMSPMGRPRGAEKVMSLRPGIGASPSPSPKGPSVQERIRALQASRR